MCNLLANAQAPNELQAFIGGAMGFAMSKESKEPGRLDARPVCCGEVWRRLVGRALLSTEADALENHLFPFQVAVN
eukprot:8133676-Karenia_brevis.AAC.1